MGTLSGARLLAPLQTTIFAAVFLLAPGHARAYSFCSGGTITVPGVGIVFQDCHAEDVPVCFVPPQPFGPQMSDLIGPPIDAACGNSEASIPVRQKNGTIKRVPLHSTNIVFAQSDQNTTVGTLSSSFRSPMASDGSPMGIVVKKNAKDKPICMLEVDDILMTFRLNDPPNDIKKITPGDLTSVDVTTATMLYIMKKHFEKCGESLSSMLAVRKLGESNDPRDRAEFYKKLAAFGQAGGALDFSGNGTLRSSRFYVVDGVSYNSRDFGNFMWGIAMRTLGVNYKTAMMGAEANGAFMTYSQNGNGPVPGAEEKTIILAGDSTPDQRSIYAGYQHPAMFVVLGAASNEKAIAEVQGVCF